MKWKIMVMVALAAAMAALNPGRARSRALYTAMALAGLLTVGLTHSALADPMPDYGEARPATEAEKRFIKRLVKGVNAALPLPGEGWKVEERHVKKLMAVDGASPYLDGEGSNAMFYEIEDKEPVRLSWVIRLRLPSSTEARRTAETKRYRRSMEELQKEMMAAAMSGDMEKVEKLEQEMAGKAEEKIRPDYERVMSGAARQPEPPERPEKNFSVEIELNDFFGGGYRERKYEVSAPGAKRAFRREMGKTLEYEYFMGGWEVTPDRRGWRIAFPKRHRNAASHLKALTLYVVISGDKDAVEAYLKDRFRPGPLAGILD